MKRNLKQLRLIIILLLMICISLLILVGYFGVRLFSMDIDSITKRTVTLGYNNRIGTIGVELQYDTEPVYLAILSPSGKQYDKPEIEKDQKIMRLTVISEEKGEWKLVYNQKTNRNITYVMIAEPADIVLLDDIQTSYDEKTKILNIKCLPVYKEPTDTDAILMTISIQGDNQAMAILFSNNIEANTPLELNLKLSENMQESETLNLIIATQDPDDYQNPDFRTSHRIRVK